MKKNDDKNRIKLWQERLRKNKAAMRDEHARMKKRTDLYDGTREIEKTPGAKSEGPADKASGVRNIVAELVEAQVDPSVPMPKITARKEEDEALAKIAEDFLRNETDRLPFERLNDLDERISPVQGGDYFFVEWDSERHTHDTQGELCVSLLHPRQVILQDGVNEINDMDFVIVNMAMTKNHVKTKYGVDVSMEGESNPDSRGGKGIADDVVTVHFGYFRNEKGGIGRYTWVNDTELEYLEDYQARKGKKCKKCGADMTGLSECRYCGSTKVEEIDSDKFQLYEDIQLSNGETISQYEEVWEYPTELQEAAKLVFGENFRGVENGLMMDEMGNLYEAQPQLVQKNREIPYYKPDIYPIIPRLNVSKWGKVLGDSDVDKIMDQQNMIKKCDSRIQEKLDKGGSAIGISEETDFEQTDEQLKIIRFKSPADASMFRLLNIQVDPSMDQAVAADQYEQARNILGITNSLQGRPDPTATSGVAKQIAVAQSAGRLESKRIMKNAAYADLYEVMFKFILAYSDEPRDVRHKNIDGSTTYSQFNKYDFLRQDAAGEWYWNDEFLFSVDNASTLAGNREAMWQEIRMNLQTGAFGDPKNIETLIMFWNMMAGQHYPFAAEVKEQLEQQRQNQMPQQPMQFAPHGGALPLSRGNAEHFPMESDMQGEQLQGVSDNMNMMGGLNNAL